MNPVRIHEGRGHSRQNYFCDTVQCFYEEKWRRGVHVNLTRKALTALFVCFFLSPRLSLQKSNCQFQINISFSRFRRGSKFFQGGGGSNFFREGGGGSNCLSPIETQITCDFPGGVRTPCPPSGSALGCDLFSFPVRKMMRSLLALVLVFVQLRCMFSVEPRNKIVSRTYCMTVAWFIQHLLQFVFAFFNHSIKIAQFIFAGGHISFPFQTILTDDAFRHQCK